MSVIYFEEFRTDKESRLRRDQEQQKFGSFQDWSSEDLRLLFGWLGEGAYQSDDFDLIGCVGASLLALSAMDESYSFDAKAVLNAIWFLADMTGTMHSDQLDDSEQRAIDAVCDITRKYAQIDTRGMSGVSR